MMSPDLGALCAAAGGLARLTDLSSARAGAGAVCVGLSPSKNRILKRKDCGGQRTKWLDCVSLRSPLPPSPAPAAYSSSPSLTLQMFVRDRRGLQSLSLPASELVVLVSLGLMVVVMMRLRHSLAWLHWEEGGTGSAGAAGAAGP